MLRIDSRNMNFNGSSVIGDQSFVSFNASINDPDNNGYISINISDMERFRSSLAAVEGDVIAFLEEIVKVPAAAEDEE